MTKFESVINYIFKEVTLKGIYNVNEENKILNMEDEICTIPKKMYDYINNGGKGSSFVFSSYMIYLMHQNGIFSNMIMTKEDFSTRFSVLYEDSGEKYVANPVQDIKYFTTNNIHIEDRNLMYDDTNLIIGDSSFNSSRIPLDEFNKMYGRISMLPNFYDSDITVEEAMENLVTLKK